MDQNPDWLLLQDLNFDLSDVDSLTTVQLCLVQFHPEAEEVAKSKAELLYWRRRYKAQARAKAKAKATPQPVAIAPAVIPAISAQDEITTPAVTEVNAGLAPAQAGDVSTKLREENHREVDIQTKNTQDTKELPKVDHAPQGVLTEAPETPAIGKEAPTTSMGDNIHPTSKEAGEASSALQEALDSPKTTINAQESTQVTPAQTSTDTNDIPMHTNSSPSAAPVQLEDTTVATKIARPAQTSSTQAQKEAFLDAWIEHLEEAAQQKQNELPQLAQDKEGQAVHKARSQAPNLLDRLDGGVELIKEDNQDNASSQSGKRKRGTTPPMPTAAGEPPANRPKTSASTYDKFANQRRSPTPVDIGTEDFRVVVTGDNPENDRKGRKSVGQDEILPTECTRDLACVFVGNIPPSAKDADIRPWLFSNRNFPRPVLITKLATARGTPDGPQYLRVFFKLPYEAEKAVHLLKKIPFETPPAQLVIRALDKKPGKLKLYWRDVEKWAQSYLETLASSGPSSVRKEDEPKSRAIPQPEKKMVESVQDPLPARPVSRASLPPARPTSRARLPPKLARQEADRLSHRLDADAARRSRFEDQDRRDAFLNVPLGPKGSGIEHRAYFEDRDGEESLARRVRDPETHSTSARDRPAYQSDRRREDNYDLVRRLDPSPPRRRRDYTPPRDRRESYSQDDRGNLLGRMN